MLRKLLRLMFCAGVEDECAPCPKCGSTSTEKRDGKWYCYSCGFGWF